MTAISGILDEIASAFFKPRNDGGFRNGGILAMTDEFRIFCDEIPQRGWGMTGNFR